MRIQLADNFNAQALRATGGSTRLAYLGAVSCTRKHHQRAAAAPITEALNSFAAQAGRERLAVHA